MYNIIEQGTVGSDKVLSMLIMLFTLSLQVYEHSPFPSGGDIDYRFTFLVLSFTSSVWFHAFD